MASPRYQPKPIDTSAVALDPELDKLTEVLAEHVHDIWAQQRFDDGWSAGPKRDDAKKTHPCLVAYEDLPEDEKVYDRVAAMQTVKAIVSLGYQVLAPDSDTIPGTRQSVAASWMRRLDKAAHDPNLLLALWRERDLPNWSVSVELYRGLADRFLEVGYPVMACDVTEIGLSDFEGDVHLRHLRALALARSGATADAREILQALRAEGQMDEETQGIFARTSKDLWVQGRSPDERLQHLKAAYLGYAAAYQSTGGYWIGINAATLAFLSGDTAAGEIANRVRVQCLAQIDDLPADDHARYWPLATLGETEMLLGNMAAALNWYKNAVDTSPKAYGNHAVTCRQALLIAEHAGGDLEAVRNTFRLPPVYVFAGHMVDHADRHPPRFPQAMVSTVAEALTAHLAQAGPIIGYGSAACGSDLLFHRIVQDMGGVSHVVLPYGRKEFAVDSVEFVADADWGEHYSAVLDRADVSVVSPQRLAHGSGSYEYANEVLLGLARLHAEQLGTELKGLAVWDGKAGDGPGGTAWIVDVWKRQGLDYEIIELDRLAATAPAVEPQVSKKPPASAFDDTPASIVSGIRMMALLFADVKGYSLISESQIPKFVDELLGMIGEMTRQSPHAPVIKNTWGDALYFVFESVVDAGIFALELAEKIQTKDWSSVGLPESLSMRIGLHAGPVYKIGDPVTQFVSYTGAHVSRAARIEPKTPPGQVYASQAFAALASFDRITDFACDYVGRIPLPKGYGTLPIYHVRR